MTALGMALLVIGAVVAVAEAHYPTHGVAGGIGVVAMAVGIVLAISGLGAGVLLGLVAGVAVAGTGAAVLTVSVKKAGAVKHRRIRTGADPDRRYQALDRRYPDPRRAHLRRVGQTP